MAGIDMDDFDDFMSKVEQVDQAVKGLASGEIHPDDVDDREAKMHEEENKVKAKRQAARDEKMKTVDEKKAAEVKKKQYIEDNYDELMEKVKTLQETKAKKDDARARFGRWREKNSKSLVVDYKGWDLWEPDEDPDDDIYKDAPPPDTPELRAMEADIVARGLKKRAREKLAEVERETGNRAFKAGQYSEALRCYETAIDNEKCNRSLYNNRAFAHIKLGNWMSAIEDCDKAMYIREHFDDRPSDDVTAAKSYLRRAMAHCGRGDFEAAVPDLERALAICPEDKGMKKQLKRALADQDEQCKESAVAEDADGVVPAEFQPTKDCLEQLSSCTSSEQAALLEKLGGLLSSDSQLVFARKAVGLPTVCAAAYGPAAAPALAVLYKLTMNARNMESVCGRKGFLSHLIDLGCPAVRPGAEDAAEVSLQQEALGVLAEASRLECGREGLKRDELLRAVASGCVACLLPGPRGVQLPPPTTTVAHAATLLANCSVDKEFRQVLVEQAIAGGGEGEDGGLGLLVDGMTLHALAPQLVVAQKASSALVNLGSDPALRAVLGRPARVALLLKAVQLDSGAPGSEQVVLNMLGVLSNCAVEPEVARVLTDELAVLPLLLSLMARAGDKPVVARAVLLLSRCVSKHPAPTEVAALLASLGGFGRLLGLLPAAVEPAMALAEPAAVTSDDCQLLEAAARLLAAAAVASIEAAEAIATAKGGLLAVVGLLAVHKPSWPTVSANAALCVANVAGKLDWALPLLGKAKAVDACIALAHKHPTEAGRQNAGIALARMAKNPENLERLRELHGIELLHHYVKPHQMKRPSGQ